MTALIIIGCILLFFLFLLSLKATITIAYHDQVTLSVRVLFVKIGILPKKEKKGARSMSAAKAARIRKKMAKKAAKKRDAAKEKQEKKDAKRAESSQKKKKSIADILDIISLVSKLAKEVIRRFFKHLRISVARLKVKVATPDAASTAIAYGAITQSVNLLIPILEEVKNFRLPDATELSVEADFLSDSPDIDVQLSFSIRVWHVLDIAIGAAGAFLKHQLKKLKNQ